MSTQAVARREEPGRRINIPKDNWLGFIGDVTNFTGEVHFVDCGYSTIAMPNISALKTAEQHEEGGQPPVEKAPREAAQ